MELACLDLEGVLIPEIWSDFAERTGIDELRATTRDIPDYDELLQQRLRILRENNLGLPDIQAVIDQMAPIPVPENLSTGYVSASRSSFSPTRTTSSLSP